MKELLLFISSIEFPISNSISIV